MCQRVICLPSEGQVYYGANGIATFPRLWAFDPFVPQEQLYDWTKIEARWRELWQETKPDVYGDDCLLVEKTTSNVARVPMMHKHFKSKQFILGIRNPWAYSEGIERRTRFYDVLRGAWHWNMIAAMQRENSLLDRTTILRYEDMLDNDTIRGLSPYLSDFDWDTPSVRVGGRHMPEHDGVKNRNEEQIANLSDKEIDDINDILDPDLVKYFGYSL